MAVCLVQVQLIGIFIIEDPPQMNHILLVFMIMKLGVVAMATITLSMSTTFPVAMATSAPALGLLGNSN
jgi:hypothetical membrane protein